jgi:rfaE bifunctional protein nucleotidyltransferase chain/domain
MGGRISVLRKHFDNHDVLANILRGLQSQGKKVVFTNGSFDILHVGHVRCLKDAKSRGDFLVVGLNSDRSIKNYKDPALPVFPLQERIEMVEAFSFVDYVTSFDEETADELLRKLKPDVHAKGTDYKEETVPERETVLAYGGQIVICGDKKAHSSREVIRKIEQTAARRAASAEKKGTKRKGGSDGSAAARSRRKSPPARRVVGPRSG